MNSRIITASSVVIIVSGCATFENLEKGLDGMVGKPLTYAIGQLGYPVEERSIAGDKMYIWHAENSGTYAIPHTNYNTLYSPNQTVGYTTTTYTTQSYNYNCKIMLIVDGKDIIKSWQYDGNIGGCSRYSQLLS